MFWQVQSSFDRMQTHHSFHIKLAKVVFSTKDVGFRMLSSIIPSIGKALHLIIGYLQEFNMHISFIRAKNLQQENVCNHFTFGSFRNNYRILYYSSQAFVLTLESIYSGISLKNRLCKAYKLNSWLHFTYSASHRLCTRALVNTCVLPFVPLSVWLT